MEDITMSNNNTSNINTSDIASNTSGTSASWSGIEAFCAHPRGSVRCGVGPAIVALACASATLGKNERGPTVACLEEVLHASNADADQWGHDPTVTVTPTPQGGVAFEWQGLFTPGRWLRATFTRTGATISWDTGTGRPSTHIGWALAEAGLADVTRQGTGILTWA
jgi:hypothetical protein